jgi:MFS family permease
LNLGTELKERTRDLLKPRATTDEQNIFHLYGDIAWYGILFGMIQAFLPVYVLRLDGSDTHVGLVTALPALVMMIFSIPGAQIVERGRNQLSVLLISATLQRFGYLFIALVPFVFANHRADIVVVLVGLLTIPLAVAAVAFTALFARAVAPAQRARVISIRNVWLGIATTIVAVAGGKFLDLVPLPINFQILFAIGFGAAMMSSWHLTRLQLPDMPACTHTRARVSLRALIANRAYAIFTLTAFVIHWGLFFAVPLFSIYWVRNLGASDGWIGVFNMVINATTIVFYPIWGHIATRRGNRFVLIVTTLAIAIPPTLTALAPSVEWILLPSLAAGIIAPGFTIVIFNGLLEVCPEENRATFVGVFNALVNVAVFLAPILSTILTATFSVGALLIVSAILRVIGGILVWQTGTLKKRAAY